MIYNTFCIKRRVCWYGNNVRKCIFTMQIEVIYCEMCEKMHTVRIYGIRDKIVNAGSRLFQLQVDTVQRLHDYQNSFCIALCCNETSLGLASFERIGLTSDQREFVRVKTARN